MKVKIQSSGLLTSITDVETEKPVENVFDVAWSHKFGEIPVATLSVYMTDIDVITEARVVTFCPACRQAQTRRDL